MFGFIKKFKNNSKIKKPRIKQARAKVARVIDGHVVIQNFEPDRFEPNAITLNDSIKLARFIGVSEDKIIHNLEECDKYFMN